jgi:hypothetical protein
MSVKVKGLDKAIADLNKKFINSVYPAVRKTLETTATAIEFEATLNAPDSYQIGDARIDLSFIGQKINKKVYNNGFWWNVGLDVPTSGEQWEAWMEFGTGLSAGQILKNPTYSEEVRTLARTYFRNGKGRIVGDPYLMPAFFRNTANLVDDMADEINKALK